MKEALKAKEDRPSLAILLTLLVFLLFTGIDTSAKWLITAGLAVPVVVFFRYAVHLCLTSGLAAANGDWDVWRMARPGLTLARGALLVAATWLNFISLQYLPLTVTVSIFFTLPLMTTALAAIFLGEKVGVRRWTAVAIGFAGVLVITQPWSASFHWAMILSLITTLCATCYNLITRVLAGVEREGTMQFYAALLPTIVLAPMAALNWTAPEGALQISIAIFIGFCGWAGHQVWVRALRMAEASALAPYAYVQIIYMAGASWLIFNQPPELQTVFGALIVVASGLYVWLREQTLRGR